MFTHQSCPYCSHRLLRHVRGQEIYWRCTHCREEIPASYSALQDPANHLSLVQEQPSAAEPVLVLPRSTISASLTSV